MKYGRNRRETGGHSVQSGNDEHDYVHGENLGTKSVTTGFHAPPKQESQQQKPTPPPQKAPPSLGRNELEMISRISALSQQTGLDRQEQALLKALGPYLSRDRLNKLEKAMHAAKMAKFATFALAPTQAPLKIGR